MKKFLLSMLVIGAFAGYVLFTKIRGPEEGTVVPPASLQTGITGPTAPGLATSGPAATSQPGSPSGYKDGTYTGNVADAFYGNVQVAVTISGGKITDVNFLQYPNDRSTSIEINTQAMPYLKQEAIQAQSAQVNGVTGASQTSRAFIESLQSALDKARS